MYGLPKLHKDGIPLRPVLSMVGSFNHGLAKFMGKLLEPLRTAPSVCKDSFSLAKFIKHSDLHNAYLVSFDVQSLFTNIPVDEVVKIIVDRLYPSNRMGRKTYLFNGFKRLDFERALNWCIKDNVFIFNSRLFVQIDGVAMGSPLAPILADIFMNILLETNIINRESDIKNVAFLNYCNGFEYVARCFTRYVDDIFAAFNDLETANEFLTFLNGLHPNIKFTIEEEVMGRLPFLDILLKREESCMTTTVYRKSTHSGVYAHFTSFAPFSLKLQLIRSLLHRAYEICSSYELLHAEFERIRVMMMNNGYNCDYIYSVISRFLMRKNSVYSPRFGPKPKQIYIRLPFLKDATYKLEKCINSCLSQIKCGSLRVKFFYTYSRVSDKLKFKDRSSTINNVVYYLKCDKCDADYTGETKRHVPFRMEEHTDPMTDSLVARHSAENPGHTFNTDNPKILAFEHKTCKRRIKEALFIQKKKPTLNVQEKSYKLFLFDVPHN